MCSKEREQDAAAARTSVTMSLAETAHFWFGVHGKINASKVKQALSFEQQILLVTFTRTLLYNASLQQDNLELDAVYFVFNYAGRGRWDAASDTQKFTADSLTATRPAQDKDESFLGRHAENIQPAWRPQEWYFQFDPVGLQRYLFFSAHL